MTFSFLMYLLYIYIYFVVVFFSSVDLLSGQQSNFHLKMRRNIWFFQCAVQSLDEPHPSCCGGTIRDRTTPTLIADKNNCKHTHVQLCLSVPTFVFVVLNENKKNEFSSEQIDDPSVGDGRKFKVVIPVGTRKPSKIEPRSSI